MAGKRNDFGLIRILLLPIELTFKLIYMIFVFEFKIIFLPLKLLASLFIKETNNRYGFRIYTRDVMEKMLYDLSPRGFEVLIAEMYSEKGYKTILTPSCNDYGRDVIVKTNNGDIFIECKRFSRNNYVGREIAQKLLGSVHMFNASKGIIFTTGQFHPNAYEVARMVNNLELMNANDILNMLKEFDNNRISRIFSKAQRAA